MLQLLLCINGLWSEALQNETTIISNHIEKLSDSTEELGKTVKEFRHTASTNKVMKLHDSTEEVIASVGKQ